MAYSTSVTIDGTDQSAYVKSYEHKKTIGSEISSCTVRLIRTISVSLNKVVVITDGGATIFRGVVTKTYIDGNYRIVVAEDALVITKRREYHVAGDPAAAAIKTKFQDILTAAYSGSIFTPSVSVDSGTPSPDTVTWEYKHANAFERLQKLASVCGWQFYYEASNNTIYFKPRVSGSPTLYNIAFGGTYSDNMASMPVWSDDTEEICNKVTIIGGKENGTKHEPAWVTTYPPSATANTDNYWLVTGTGFKNLPFPSGYLTYPPSNWKVWHWDGVSATETDISTSCLVQHSGSNYYMVYNKTVGGDQWIRVEYEYSIGGEVTATNASSVSAYGEFAKTIYRSDITDATELQKLADAIAGSSGALVNPYKEVKFSVVDGTTANLGGAAEVRDGFNGITATSGMYVSEINYAFPTGKSTITVTNKPFKDFTTATRMEDRIKRLEEEQNRLGLAMAGAGSGATNFTDLADVPASYVDQQGKIVKVNATSDGLEFSDATFTGLTDTPDDYTGNAGKYVKVNNSENGLEFGVGGGGGSSLIEGAECSGVVQPKVEAGPVGYPCEVHITVGHGGKLRIIEGAN